MVTFNSATTLPMCLQTAFAAMDDDDELIVVDNASTDATLEMLREWAAKEKRLLVIPSPTNLGFAPATNLAIQAGAGRFVCLLNPDTEVVPGWLERMIAHFNSPTVGAVGPTSDWVAGRQKVALHVPTGLTGEFDTPGLDRLLAHTNRGQSEETRLLIGFCLMVPRAVLDQFGLLDEGCVLGSDDLELCWRLRLNGLRLKIARDVFVRHNHHTSFRSVSESVTAPLAQASHDHLARKLIAHYGEGNVPPQEELWGISWFSPSIPVWKPSVPKVLCLNLSDPEALCIGPGLDIDLDLSRPLPLNAIFETTRWGQVQLTPGAFHTVRMHECLEEVDDVADWMKTVCDLIPFGGEVEVTTTHWLAPKTWIGDAGHRLFSLSSWSAFSDAPDALGWEGFRLSSTNLSAAFTDFGSQLHFNRGAEITSLLNEPRAFTHLTLRFRKDSFSVPPVSALPKPMATVVLPVYRRGALAERAIDAVLGQSLAQIEVFIIGDACPEHEARLADPYFQARVKAAERRGMTVHALNLPSNHGTPHAAINLALARAQGEYFLWMGDDDFVLPNHVENYLGAICGSRHDAVLIDSILVGDFYTNLRQARLELGHVGHSELIVRTDAARLVPEHRPGKYQDWEFLAELSKAGTIGKAEQRPATFYVNLCRRVTHFRAA